MTPNTYRNGGQNVQITYTIMNRPFGQILIVATDKGVSAVQLGDGDAPLEAGFKNEYQKAKVERLEGQLHEWVGLMLTTLDGHPVTHSLPIDWGPPPSSGELRNI